MYCQFTFRWALRGHRGHNSGVHTGGAHLGGDRADDGGQGGSRHQRGQDIGFLEVVLWY